MQSFLIFRTVPKSIRELYVDIGSFLILHNCLCTETLASLSPATECYPWGTAIRMTVKNSSPHFLQVPSYEFLPVENICIILRLDIFT